MEETRRGRKHARQEKEAGGGGSRGGGGGGHYADPMSPIASTPMKRPRTKPANTKSAKGKNAGVGSASKSAAQQEEEEKFFSPRKLAKEYDDVDDDDEEDGGERKAKKSRLIGDKKVSVAASEMPVAPPKDGLNGKKAEEAVVVSSPGDSAAPSDGTNGVMFSPVLKVPRTSRSASNGNSPVSDARARLDSAFASADSSKTATPDKSVQENAADDENQVHCDENSIVNDEVDSASDGPVETEFNPFVFIKSLPKYRELVPNARATVLPAKTKHSPDVCLVLDLDETLVHCTVDHVENPHLQFPVTFNGVDYTVNVKKRPHMEYFLKQVSTKFEVVVFTASHRAYAEKLLNLIDPRRELIKYRLYREDCLDVYGNYLKDLNVLGRNLSKVVLVDNSPHAFGYQVNNGIPIETWYDDEADDELLNLLPFLESLIVSDDVRPIVEKQFQTQKLIDSLPDELI